MPGAAAVLGCVLAVMARRGSASRSLRGAPRPSERPGALTLLARDGDAVPVALAASSGAVVGLAVGGPILAGLAAAASAGGVVARRVIRARRSADRARRAVPDVLDEVARTLRGGGVMTDAFQAAARRSGSVGEHGAAVSGRVALGVPLRQALASWESDYATTRAGPAVRVAASALAVAAESGRDVAVPLDGLARGLRDEEAARAEVRAQAAQGRASAYVIGGLPVVALAFTVIVDPAAAHGLLTHPLGRWCLLSGLALEAAGVAAIRWILRGAVGLDAR